MKHLTLLALLSTAFVSTASSLTAQTFLEGSDAGIRAATAKVVPPGVNRISGTLKPGTTNAFGVDPVDADVFAFTIRRTTAVQIDANSEMADMNLLLLKEGFFGVEGDDDHGVGGPPGFNYNSRINIVLPPGTYYIAVGPNNIGAFPFGAMAIGDVAWENGDGLLNESMSSVPIDFIGSNESGAQDATAGESYEIRFSFTTSVTGLDLSAGPGPRKLKGVDILGTNGKRQTIRIAGNRSVKYRQLLTNTGANRLVGASLSKGARDLDLSLFETGGRKRNVTARFKTGKYRKSLASGTMQAYEVSVSSKNRLRNTAILMNVRDSAMGAIRDTAGAKVTIR